ncbi:MAG: signal peptidase I [Leptolyngbyaceae cyanobacterium bins.349]|nr:signal peptidase I [Leptolyngbyaceae cyanobacterium bins.349]
MTSENTSKPQATAPLPTAKSPWKIWWDNFQILFIALILALLIRLFVAEPRFIPSDSMVPTLEIGDRLVVEKVSYRLHPPHRGDIIVFDPPLQLQEYGFRKDQAFIKRVIGEPGQTVRVFGGTVYVDDRPLMEPYIAAPPDYVLPTVRVPPGQLFVMGDNRPNSNDSHVWGFLPIENIIGRACFRFYPFDRLGRIQST